MDTISHPIILFDGVCNLCNNSVQFIIQRDKKKLFRFAALQSDFAQKLLTDAPLSIKKLDSIVLVEHHRYYTQSDAALRIAKKLDGAWKGLGVFLLVPAFIRNAIYNFVAKNRYTWFGKQDTCMMPNPELKKLFLN